MLRGLWRLVSLEGLAHCIHFLDLLALQGSQKSQLPLLMSLGSIEILVPTLGIDHTRTHPLSCAFFCQSLSNVLIFSKQASVPLIFLFFLPVFYLIGFGFFIFYFSVPFSSPSR